MLLVRLSQLALVGLIITAILLKLPSRQNRAETTQINSCKKQPDTNKITLLNQLVQFQQKPDVKSQCQSPPTNPWKYPGRQVALTGLNPKIAAFMDMTAYSEGTYRIDGYRIKFGYGTFNNFSKHPNDCIRFWDKRSQKWNCSTASGRYQFTFPTWQDFSKGLIDFSPVNQDKAFIQLLKFEGAYSLIISGKFDSAVFKLCGRYASFPCSYQGKNPAKQKVRKLASLRKFYLSRLKVYKNSKARGKE